MISSNLSSREKCFPHDWVAGAMNPLRIASAQTHKQTSIRYYCRMLVYFLSWDQSRFEKSPVPLSLAHMPIRRDQQNPEQLSWRGARRGSLATKNSSPQISFFLFPFHWHTSRFGAIGKIQYSFLGKGCGGNRSLATKNGFPRKYSPFLPLVTARSWWRLWGFRGGAGRFPCPKQCI